jgi:transcriptional regulator with XRE-family HTH domain
MNLNEAFDQTLKYFEISAKSLSEQSGVAPQTISDFRRGKKTIQTDSLEKLLKSLSIEAQAHFFSLSVGGKLTPEKIMLSVGKDWELLISTASPGDIEEILHALSDRYSQLKKKTVIKHYSIS